MDDDGSIMFMRSVVPNGPFQADIHEMRKIDGTVWVSIDGSSISSITLSTEPPPTVSSGPAMTPELMRKIMLDVTFEPSPELAKLIRGM